MKRVLSIDIPWGGAHFVGAALAELDGCNLLSAPRVVAIDSAAHDRMVGGVPEFPAGDPEVAGFIGNGCGLERAMSRDLNGPFRVGFPVTASARQPYLENIWRAFHSARQLLGCDAVDLVLVDVPLVSRALAQLVLNNGWNSRFRPVELAFGSKVMIPGANQHRPDGRIQFPRFQLGILSGCRPGYALCALARLAFNAAAAVESFPQLEIGSLAEYAAAVGLPLLPKLAAHKNGNASPRAAAQAILMQQLSHFFGNQPPNWIQPNLAARARPDGFDALLGIVPGIVRCGFRAGHNGPWNQAVILLNHAAGLPAFPQSAGVGNPVQWAGPWLELNLPLQLGTDDQGILACRLAMWG